MVIDNPLLYSDSYKISSDIYRKECTDRIIQNKISIIRIEAPDGYGIFSDMDSNKRERTIKNMFDLIQTVHNRHTRFPTPILDNKMDVNKDNKEYFCAYKNLRQLKQWIKPYELKIIIEEGYNVFRLIVTDYQVGEHQIIYTKESILKSKNINSLFV